MKTCLTFCKENNNYLINEKLSNKQLVVINSKEISIVEIFNAIFMDYIVSHENCSVEIENTVINDEEANEIFIKVKTLLAEISNDINNYLNSLLTQI